MSAPLSEGTNYLFFPKGSVSGGKVTGTANADVSTVCTKRFIFVFPKMLQHSVIIASTTQRFEFEQGVPIEEGLRKLLAGPKMSVEDLEEDLKSRLHDDWVFEISALAHFKMHKLWILSQIRMNKKGGNTVVLAVRGNGGMKRLFDFYA